MQRHRLTRGKLATLAATQSPCAANTGGAARWQLVAQSREERENRSREEIENREMRKEERDGGADV